MKKSSLLFSFRSVAVALLASTLLLLVNGCSDSHAGLGDEAHAHVAPAATYREGHGVQLSPTATQLVGLAVADVESRAFAGGEAAAIPTEALLRTVKGDFVYVANGGSFLRTPVKVGVTHGLWLEVVDGLYEGDRVVSQGVRALWLAELQAVNGGVGCADGH